MIWLTDAKTEQKIAVNPKHIVAVFVASEGEFVNKTFVGMINGNLIVNESDLEVVTAIQGGA